MSDGIPNIGHNRLPLSFSNLDIIGATGERNLLATAGQNSDEFSSPEIKYYENYSNEVLKPNTVQRKQKVSFPYTEKTSTIDIENFIKENSSKAYELLIKLKEKTPKEKYSKYIAFIKRTMNEFKGHLFYFIDQSMLSDDILYGLTVELYREDGFYSKGNTDEKLNNFLKFLNLQKNEGILFSFSGSSELVQTDKGLNVTINMFRDLKGANIDIQDEHFDVLFNIVGPIKKMILNNNPNLSEDNPEMLQKSIVTLVNYLQTKIAPEIIHIERIKPGSSRDLGKIVTNFLSNEDSFYSITDYLKTINRYIDGLVIQGETDIEDVLFNLASHSGDIKLTDENVDKLLRLHFYSGFSKPFRLVHTEEENKQETFNKVLDRILSSFEDSNVGQRNKVTAVILPAVIDDTADKYKFDIFAVRAGRMFKKLYDEGYKILPFEIDKDSQIIDSLIRAQSATNQKPNLLIVSGHGSVNSSKSEDAMATVLGKTRRQNSFQGINPAIIDEIKSRNPDLAGRLDKRKPLPLWKAQSVGNGEVTFDEASLDRNDTDIMQNIGLLMAIDGKVVFNSCAVGKQVGGKPPLAEVLSSESGLQSFASNRVIQDTILIFQNGVLIDVKYEDR